MSSVLKVDRIQSDTGTVNISSNVAFSGVIKVDQIQSDTGSIVYPSNVSLGNTSITNFGSTGVNARLHVEGVINLNDDQALAWGGGTGRPSIRGNKSTSQLDLYGTPVFVGFGQLKFPATQNASSDPNTLDDYEEGTWSPEIRPTSGGSYSWAIQAGRYIKVGSLVTLHGRVVFGTVTTPGTGILFLTNLPFANLNTGDSGSRSVLSIGRADTFTTNQPSTGAFIGNGGSTALELYFRSSANGATLDQPAASMTTNAGITFSITYTAA